MPELTVPGAILHYETFGTGPLLVFIQGAQGTGKVFHPCAQLLSSHFTVLCYDRRGFSESHPIGAQDLPNRLQTDADDAQHLIQHLSPDAGAIVLGTSSGALVAQQLLASHPECVSKLISHEPPAFSLLPEEFKLQAAGLMDHIYNTYRAQGIETAINVFASGISEGPDAEAIMHAMDAKRGIETRANAMFWFEFELRQYTSAEVDVEGLRRAKEKLVLVAGEDSGDGPCVGPLKVLGGMLGLEVGRVPKGHLGYTVDPEAFSKGVLEICK